MRRNIRRILSLLMTVVVMMAMLSVCVLPASAATYGDLYYSVTNGEVTITDCKTSASGALDIPAKINGYPVTSIGSSAFSGCTGLTSIAIPDSVTTIGDWAFEDCTGLTSVTIGNGVTRIGYGVFRDCTGLTGITIPDSVTSIGDWAFSGCTGLEAVYITDIAAWCAIDFYDYDSNPLYYAGDLYLNNEKVTALTIPNSVTSIGKYAFHGCTGLTGITIPDSVTSIGYEAFSYCTGLTGITIPNSVTSIGNMAFSGCTGLTGITIPDSVTSISEYAFYGCTGLTGITIPDSVTTIGSYAFEDCTGLTSVTIGNGVTNISEYAFHGCTGLTGITIPDSVTSIGDWAFSGCTGLEAVYITDIAAWCAIDFYDYDSNPLYYAGDLYLNNEKVTTLTIPDGVTTIGSSAFSGCTGLTSIAIPDSVTSIGGGAFYGCTGLTSITIPNSVTNIDMGAFNGCTSLTSVTIGDGVTAIDSGAFYGCTGLTVITIPDSVTSIGYEAFYGCTGLTSVTIGNGVTSIGYEAFYGCTALKTVYLPKSLSWIQDKAFYGCIELTDVYYGSTLTSRIYNIDFNDNNERLQGAEWHYACSTCSYDNACDTTCNNCWKTRTITHSYGEYVYNNDATYEKDGTKTRTCSVCSNKETITAEGTKLTQPVINNPFNDVKEGKFYYDAVLWAVNNDVTTGTSANTFSPENKCTRGQIVTFLWRAAGSPKASTTNTAFTDIKEGSYYYDAVIWAVENGITSGTTATTFSPNSTCTRGQIVTFLWRAKGQQKATIANPFKDTTGGAYYTEAMLWAVENNITTGTSATTFSPNNACTRGQCVTFLYRSFSN